MCGILLSLLCPPFTHLGFVCFAEMWSRVLLVVLPPQWLCRFVRLSPRHLNPLLNEHHISCQRENRIEHSNHSSKKWRACKFGTESTPLEGKMELLPGSIFLSFFLFFYCFCLQLFLEKKQLCEMDFSCPLKCAQTESSITSTTWTRQRGHCSPLN